MEHASLLSLAVLTLLQLCRAERMGSWYSANVINGKGEFAPKPISEIFSTSDPIIILPSSTSSPIETYPTSAKTGSSPYSTTASTYDYVSSTQSSYPTETTYDTKSMPQQWNPPQSTYQTQLPPTKQDQMDLKAFPFPMMPQPESKNPPNYFLIYQQAPQNIQNFPTPAALQAPSASPPSSYPTESTYTSQTSTYSPEPTSYKTDSTPYHAEVTSYQPDPTSYQTDPTSYKPDPTYYQPDKTSFRTESTTYHRDESSWQPEKSTPYKTKSNYPEYSSTYPPKYKTGKPYKSSHETTDSPCDSKGKPLKNEFKFPSLRIRVASPRGTITNINLNPPISTTTKKPTTTKRVTTTKTRRTKKTKNNYDGCMKSCDGKKSPICASPLSMKQIDPDSLKGFPSICHMACHNSFKKNQYEMLVDGRCGRLRTRIRTVDSYNKMKKEELNKVQYAIVDHPQTVLEFASLPR